MNPILIGLGIGLITWGLGIKLPGIKYKTDEKLLTDEPETSKKGVTASKKRAKTENDETINDNKDDSNLNSGGSANVDDLGESENED